MSSQELSNDLENLISLMDEYFTVIYERFPKMESSLESFQEETRILLDYFVKTKGEEVEEETEASSAEKFRIAQILGEINANIQEVDNSLLTREEIEELLQEFSSTKQEEKVNLLEIIDIAEKVDEALSDIELVSLNAIIFASQMGNTGAPFSVIAENIKDLSLRVSQDNAQMQELTQEIKPWFDGFHDNISNLMEFRDYITREHLENVNQRFTYAVESLGEIGRLLNDLLNNVNTVLEPGRQLMSLIQHQDILRQGLENAHQLVEDIHKEEQGSGDLLENTLSDKESVEDGEEELSTKLDHLSFKVESLQLAKRLTEGVNYQLKEALKSISEQLQELGKGLEGPIEDSYFLNTFFSGYVSAEKKDQGAVDHTFADINSLVEMYIKVVEELNQRCSKLTADRESMVSHLEKGKKLLDKVEKSLDQLEKLRFLSAIELAKMDMQKHYFNTEIEKISNKVVKAVSDNRQYFEEIKKIFEAHLLKLEGTMSRSQEKIEQVRGLMQRAQEELDMVCSIINQAINTMHEELKNLQGEIGKIEKDFKPVWEMVERCEQLDSKVGRLLQEALREQEKHLARSERDSWSSQEERISSKARQFVDYLESMDVESATEEITEDTGGELTLF